jgi:hypothetical protein
MKILVDTNVWLSENLLRSPKGLSLTAFCYKNGHKLLVPEIVEKEIEVNFFRNAIEKRDKIQENYRYLLATLGKLKELILPGDEEVRKALSDRLLELYDIIERISFTFDQAKTALEMVINYLPPNCKSNQQFKDSAIWVSALDASSNSEIAFITADKGFYTDKKVEKGLASNILDGIKNADNKISVYQGLDGFLDKNFKSNKIIDATLLADKIFEEEKERISKHVSEFDISIQRIILNDLVKYVTGKDALLSIDYKGVVEIVAGETSPKDPFYLIEGSCLFDISKNVLEQNFLNSFDFQWIDENGDRKDKRSKNVYAFGNIVLGHRTVEYQLKHEI